MASFALLSLHGETLEHLLNSIIFFDTLKHFIGITVLFHEFFDQRPVMMF
jgi:hypothetical protein